MNKFLISDIFSKGKCINSNDSINIKNVKIMFFLYFIYPFLLLCTNLKQ